MINEFHDIFLEHAQELDGLRRQIKELTNHHDRIRDSLIIMLEEGGIDSLTVSDYTIRLLTGVRVGGLDQEKLESDGINLNDYRKPSIITKTIKVSREGLGDSNE